MSLGPNVLSTAQGQDETIGSSINHRLCFLKIWHESMPQRVVFSTPTEASPMKSLLAGTAFAAVLTIAAPVWAQAYYSPYPYPYAYPYYGYSYPYYGYPYPYYRPVSPYWGGGWGGGWHAGWGGGWRGGGGWHGGHHH
jgi:hypothetical protein